MADINSKSDNSCSEEFNFRKILSESSDDDEDNDDHYKRKRIDIRERTQDYEGIRRSNDSNSQKKDYGFKKHESKNMVAPFKTNYDDRFNERPIKRPSTPPPYLLGKRPAFSSMLSDLAPQSKEAPVMKKHEPGRPFPFVNHYKGGIPPPPKNSYPDKQNKEGEQHNFDKNKVPRLDSFERNQHNNMQMGKNLQRNLND